VVTGTDATTNAPAEMKVLVGGMGEAEQFAAKRGITVQSIRTDTGAVWAPNGNGGFKRVGADGKEKAQNQDKALLLFAFLIPLVGLIAGAIRLSQRDKSGAVVLVWALIGAFVWTILLAAMNR
jgi:hypothetical protein